MTYHKIMKPLTRKNIKILLINDTNKHLLMCIDDPNNTNLDDKQRPHFWAPVGGKIEEGKTALQAAIRELFEETGLSAQDVSFGPIVWHEQFELLLYGEKTLCDQEFIVTQTINSEVSLNHHFYRL